MSQTLTSTNCGGGLHIRVWAGGPSRPDTCACGQVRYAKCVCRDCGTSHEHEIRNDVVTGGWNTHDEVWSRENL